MSEMVYRVTRAICDNMNYSEAWHPCEYAGGVCSTCGAIMEGLGVGAIDAVRDVLEWLLEDPPATLDEPDPDAEVIIKMRAIVRAALSTSTREQAR